MSKALPGNHYCKEHQGNSSHYAPHNCDLCKALANLPAEAEKLVRVVKQVAALQEHVNAANIACAKEIDERDRDIERLKLLLESHSLTRKQAD